VSVVVAAPRCSNLIDCQRYLPLQLVDWNVGEGMADAFHRCEATLALRIKPFKRLEILNWNDGSDAIAVLLNHYPRPARGKQA
jgi:hypothetical protein